MNYLRPRPIPEYFSDEGIFTERMATLAARITNHEKLLCDLSHP